MTVRAVPPSGEPQPRRRVIVERAAAFGVTAFDIADDDSVQLWVGGELVGWFKPGAVQAVYYADTLAAEPQAG